VAHLIHVASVAKALEWADSGDTDGSEAELMIEQLVGRAKVEESAAAEVTKLKPCPFCGSDEWVCEDSVDVGEGVIRHYGCDACEVYFDTPEKWNRRAPSPDLAAENERLREALSDAIQSVASAPARCCGDFMLHTPQIGTRQVDQWRACLESRP
jgi:hypothetical protein